MCEEYLLRRDPWGDLVPKTEDRQDVEDEKVEGAAEMHIIEIWDEDCETSSEGNDGCCRESLLSR